jgi:hypothetical protein
MARKIRNFARATVQAFDIAVVVLIFTALT